MQLEIRTDLVGTDEMEEVRDEQTGEKHFAVDHGNRGIGGSSRDPADHGI